MKKLQALILSISIIFAGFTAFAANDADKNVSVFYDGEQMTFDAEPFIENDRTLVPMRAIFEKAGSTVSWDDETKTVIAISETGEESQFVVIQIGNSSAFVNGEAKELDTAALIVNDRTFVPLKFVMENLGSNVTWDADTYTVNIQSK